MKWLPLQTQQWFPLVPISFIYKETLFLSTIMAEEPFLIHSTIELYTARAKEN